MTIIYHTFELSSPGAAGRLGECTNAADLLLREPRHPGKGQAAVLHGCCSSLAYSVVSSNPLCSTVVFYCGSKCVGQGCIGCWFVVCPKRERGLMLCHAVLCCRRDESAASMYSAASSMSSSREAGYSRSESTPAYQRPTNPYVPQLQSTSATAGPMLQILATALGQSRQTLERLQVRMVVWGGVFRLGAGRGGL